MVRIGYIVLSVLLILLVSLSWKQKQELLRLEQLLWTEFDAGVDGLTRMLALVEAAPRTSSPALLAAYEHGLAVNRLGAVVESLLRKQGVRAEALPGYLLSLTGGVASVCDDARLRGTPDTVWIAEIRSRLEQLSSVLNAQVAQTVGRKELQRRIDLLFGSEPSALHFIVPTGSQPVQCALYLP